MRRLPTLFAAPLLALLLALVAPVGLVRAQDDPADDPPASPPEERPLDRPEPDPRPGFVQSLHVGIGVDSELNDRFALRVFAGFDLPDLPLTLRATFDYARQGPFGVGGFASAGHLLYRFDDEAVRGYAGAGLGFQLAADSWDQAASSGFASALVGAEYRVGGPFGAFVEARLDIVFDPSQSSEEAYAYDTLYPTISAGLTFRLP